MEVSESTHLIIKLFAENCGNSTDYYKPRRIGMYTEITQSRLDSDVPRENTSVPILCLPQEQRNSCQYPYYS